ncbi:DUF4476 domain-containing protein [Chryseotalea sanaruensis]|nr:DUF4476 domain-containing protein [Chryseotalea sanaruensis]
MRALILFMLLILGLEAFAQDCTNPIDKSSFQEGFNQVAIQGTNAKKLDVALLFIKDKCLVSAQVKTMAQLFSEDQPRLIFSTTAFKRTSDPANFYEVMDAFTNLSYAFRLYDIIKAPVKKEPAVTVPVNPPLPIEQVLTFPRYNYPSSIRYAGVKGCNGPVANEEIFRRTANNAFYQPTEEAKEVVVVNAVETACFDFAQAMKLISTFRLEETKLKVLIKIFPRVYDQEAYRLGAQLFLDTKLREEWLKYASFYLAPPAPACEESDADFQKVLKKVQDKFFDHERISLIETLAIDHCFKVSQIKKMFTEISQAARKPDLLKKLYDKCPDKKNYYLLVDDLIFQSEKEELKSFIKSKGNN